MEPVSERRSANEVGFMTWLVHRLTPYWGRCLLVALAILMQVAFRVLVPMGYQEIFDGAIVQRDLELLTSLLALLMAGWAVHGFAGLGQDYLSAWISSRAMNDLRERMFGQLQRLSSAYYARVDSGDVMSRFSNDLAVIEQALAQGIYTAFFSFFNLTGSLVLLFWVEWRLAAVTLAILVAAYLFPSLLGPRARDKAYERKASEAEVAAAVQESIGAHSMVRAFDLREYVSAKFRALLDRLAVKTVAAQFSSALVGRTAGQSVFFVQIMMMGLGGWLAIEGALSVGALVGFAALLQNVANASNHLAAVTPELLRASGGVRRVQEFLSEEPESAEPQGTEALGRLSRDIVFDGVSFAYEDQNPLLDGLSFRVRAGESVALVGPSGSGKSTVLNLLLRLRNPSAGAIRFDGTDIRQAREESLLDQIGIVLQETFLLKTSFAENIRLGRLAASEPEIVEAAKLAKIHGAIMEKPLGYDALVGEAGRHLSVGQRQRIAIARAILRDPALLVLDEATSALDPATEAAVHKTLAEVGRGRTVFAATHRLSSVVEADRILVLEKGRLVEEGRHQELLDRGGTYFQLWRKQSGFEIHEDGRQAQVSPSRLEQIPLLSRLGEVFSQSIADQFASQFLPEGRFVFRQGDVGEAFYIIVKGRVEVLVEDERQDQRRAVLEDGDFFGELALLDAKPRSATVRTLSSTLLLTLQRRQFELFLKNRPDLRAAIEEQAMKRR